MERNYWVVRQGKGGKFIDYAKAHNVIGLGWSELEVDYSPYKKLEQKEFVAKIAPELEKVTPDRPAGNYASGARQLYKFVSVIQINDVVIVPSTEDGMRYIGVVQSDYYFTPQTVDFPFNHRRDVKWVTEVHKDIFSQDLKNSSGSIMSVFSLSPHAEEIDRLIAGASLERLPLATGDIESLKEFGMEAHLEDFIIENWSSIDAFDGYEIYKEDDQEVGQQYVTDIGRLDILAKSVDGKKWLVIELKKGKTSDDVVGQTLRYLAWVRRNLCENSEEVNGLIVVGERDDRLEHAVSEVADKVRVMLYKVSFRLEKY